MSLDPATVKRVARLARIHVHEDDLPALSTELTSILSWIEQLDEVNVEDVQPLVAVHNPELPAREDAVTDGDKVEAVLANAPAAAHGYFTVPKMVE